MDESTPRSPRPRVVKGSSRKAAAPRIAKPNPSAHVIDLRQGNGAAAAKQPAPVVRRARSAGGGMDMAPRKRPVTAPPVAPVVAEPDFDVLADEPLEQPAATPRQTRRQSRPQAAAPAANPINQPDAEPIDAYAAGEEYDLVSTKRFWPAFWRFLFLLILLGVVITGGIFLYLGYFRNG